MIIPNLFKTPQAVDSVRHRGYKLASPVQDWSIASALNSVFLASVEFGDACSEYPIVFIEAGKDEQGRAEVAPIAVLGLNDKQNLFVDGGKWRANYQPALLRAYPLGIARQDATRVVVVMDEGYSGWSQTDGQPMFDEKGEPSAFLGGMRDQLEKVEAEIQRTRHFGRLLVEAELLTPQRFDATLPDGQKLMVDGFMTVDEAKFGALPDEKILQMHKNGALGLIHAHQISLRHMRKLVEWHVQRVAAAPAAPAA